MTPMVGAAATSALKRAYFGDWPRNALLHLYCPEAGVIGLGLARGKTWIAPSPGALEDIIRSFDPQVILYRPVAEQPQLHEFAMGLAFSMRAPLALWLMDDWPARLEEADPAVFARMDADLRRLFRRSSFNLAISDKMSAAFERRYGAAFAVARGGVDMERWPIRKRRHDDVIHLRYAGSLAPDMTRSSVLDIAQSVARLSARGEHVALDIRTMPHWLEVYGELFMGLAGVTISPSNMSEAAYRQWLCDADIVVAAYNFDAASQRYTQYSFANKTPELLASGAAVLAYGPSVLETISILSQSGAAIHVDRRSPEDLDQAIATLLGDDDLRARLGARGREAASRLHRISDQREMVRRRLSDLARRAGAPDTSGVRPLDWILDRHGELHVNSRPIRRFATAIAIRFPGLSRAFRSVKRRLRGGRP
ncbi:MAG: glycosyltransferase [Parvularculaceae bacterium]